LYYFKYLIFHANLLLNSRKIRTFSGQIAISISYQWNRTDKRAGLFFGLA